MKTRFTEAQIVGSFGRPMRAWRHELRQKHGPSEASYHVWQRTFGGMTVAEAEWLEGIEVSCSPASSSAG